MQYMYVYIPKYHLLCAHDITCVYVLSADHSAWTTKWCAFPCRGSPLKFPVFFFFQLFTVLYVRLSKALLALLMMLGILICHSCSAHIWVVMLMRLCGGCLGCYQEA